MHDGNPSCPIEIDRSGLNSIGDDGYQSYTIGASRSGLNSIASDRDPSETMKSHRKQLKIYGEEARHIGSWYSKHKFRILSDIRHTETYTTNSSGTTHAMVSSPTHGTAFMDDSVEQLCQIVQDLKDFPIGEIIEAWTNPGEECPEEMETPDPLAFGEEILHYMEMTNDEARDEYYSLLDTHISPAMRKAVPRVIDIMTSPAALETFAPSEWNGLKIKPIEFNIIPGMPTSMPVRARNIRPDLYAHAKKEFDRLVLYFYESDRTMCTSPIASPLVIAPKATSPYIRFCGDYRRINDFISIPKHPIPIVPHELTKASQFKVFIDLDMTNSFHQLPLSEPASQLLSVQTPWGLVRPKFLPEGVGPASGLLQSVVGDIFDFEDFKDWTIVIFDNFLVLANDYEDAASKLERVIDRCAAYGVVLKIKKSFIGVDTVTFLAMKYHMENGSCPSPAKIPSKHYHFPSHAKRCSHFLERHYFSTIISRITRSGQQNCTR